MLVDGGLLGLGELIQAVRSDVELTQPSSLDSVASCIRPPSLLRGGAEVAPERRRGDRRYALLWLHILSEEARDARLELGTWLAKQGLRLLESRLPEHGDIHDLAALRQLDNTARASLVASLQKGGVPKGQAKKLAAVAKGLSEESPAKRRCKGYVGGCHGYAHCTGYEKTQLFDRRCKVCGASDRYACRQAREAGMCLHCKAPNKEACESFGRCLRCGATTRAECPSLRATDNSADKPRPHVRTLPLAPAESESEPEAAATMAPSPREVKKVVAEPAFDASNDPPVKELLARVGRTVRQADRGESSRRHRVGDV